MVLALGAPAPSDLALAHMALALGAPALSDLVLTHMALEAPALSDLVLAHMALALGALAPSDLVLAHMAQALPVGALAPSGLALVTDRMGQDQVSAAVLPVLRRVRSPLAVAPQLRRHSPAHQAAGSRCCLAHLISLCLLLGFRCFWLTLACRHRSVGCRVAVAARVSCAAANGAARGTAAPWWQCDVSVQ
jgi:hypothetical protein